MDTLGKFGEHSRSQSCSRLSPRAGYFRPLRTSHVHPTRYTHAKHEPILKSKVATCSPRLPISFPFYGEDRGTGATGELAEPTIAPFGTADVEANR